MPSLATPSDLRRFPGVDASLDDVTADAALGRAERSIIAELGWPLWEDTYTVEEYGPVVVLPALHVTAVSVTVGGVVQVEPWFTWKPNGIVKFSYWFHGPAVITYTAGFTAATMPGVIKDACVKLAADELSGTASNLRSKSWTVGGESETEAYDTTVGGYSIDTDRRLDDYRMTAAVA